MPGRQQIPSFQIASGTTNERDNSYNIPTGSIFYNTDTSNIELSGNVVVAGDVSINNHLSCVDASFQGNVVVAGDISASTIDVSSINLAINSYTWATFYSGHNGSGHIRVVWDGCLYRKLGEFYLLSINYNGHGYVSPAPGPLGWGCHSIKLGLGVDWFETGSGVTSAGVAIYTTGNQWINLRSNGGIYTRCTLLLAPVPVP